MAVTERPYNYCFSKNEIRYVFTVSGDPLRSGLYLQVRLKYKRVGDADYIIFYTWEALKPNAAGIVYLPMQAYIDALVTYVLPGITGIVTDATQQCVQFYIESREVDDVTPDPAWDTTESENSRIALKGGIERHKTSGNNVFINYIQSSAKPFLTWQPSKRFVFYDEPVYLTFLNTTGEDFQLYIELFTTAGAYVWTVINFAAETKLLYHVNVSPSVLNLAALTAADIYLYQITVRKISDGAVIANAYTFYLEKRPTYESYDLVWNNSIGGVDAVKVVGDTPVSYDRTITETEGGMAVNDWNADERAADKSFSSILLRRNYKGNIGSLKTRTREQQESFVDLTASKRVFMRIDNRWVPVNITNKNIDLGTRKITTAGFLLEWQLSDDNDLYTPSNKMFGLGT